MDVLTAQLFRNMTAYDAGDPARIQHFTKVYAYADLIGTSEGLTEGELRVLRAAAILHDIGIHKSEEKYGDDNGKHQELEGPPEAGKLLSRVEGYTEDEKRRILYLIGHHHSYTEIDGSDYQILVEADFLVNLFENHPQSIDKAAAAAALSRIFRTKSGKEMLEMMFLREEYKKPGNEWKSAADTAPCGRELILSHAEPSDVQALAAVERECFPQAEAATAGEIEERVRSYGDHFFVLKERYAEQTRLISFVDGFVTDEADLTDEMYADASMHNENGSWQMIFGVNTVPERRKHGYAAMLLERAIGQAREQGRKGVVLTCKERLIPYYAKFGFVNEGVSVSVHGNVVWYQMRLTF